MKKVFFLLNKLDEFNFQILLNKYLPNASISIGESLPSCTDDFDLIILWSYRKIIKHIKNNMMVFHSSDLPNGKGWAPIYNSFAQELSYYTISGIILSDKIDSGDIVVKARFKVKNNYTATFIRQWDSEISILLISSILNKFTNKEIIGQKQENEGSFYSRRVANDNEIDTKQSFTDIIAHLRGCEHSHPAFFFHKDSKYYISIQPEIEPQLPSDIEIFFDKA